MHLFLSPPPDILSHFYLQIVACLLKPLILRHLLALSETKLSLRKATSPGSSLSGVFFYPSLSLWDEGAETLGIFQVLQSYFHTGTVSLSFNKNYVFYHLSVYLLAVICSTLVSPLHFLGMSTPHIFPFYNTALSFSA